MVKELLKNVTIKKLILIVVFALSIIAFIYITFFDKTSNQSNNPSSYKIQEAKLNNQDANKMGINPNKVVIVGTSDLTSPITMSIPPQFREQINNNQLDIRIQPEVPINYEPTVDGWFVKITPKDTNWESRKEYNVLVNGDVWMKFKIEVPVNPMIGY